MVQAEEPESLDMSDAENQDTLPEPDQNDVHYPVTGVFESV